MWSISTHPSSQTLILFHTYEKVLPVILLRNEPIETFFRLFKAVCLTEGICQVNLNESTEEKPRDDSLRPQRCPAVADDGGLLPTVGVEEQPVGRLCVWSEGERWPGPAHIWRQSPHDGVVASESVTVVVVVDYGDFDGHAVEVDHAVDHAGSLGSCYTCGKPPCVERRPMYFNHTRPSGKILSYTL